MKRARTRTLVAVMVLSGLAFGVLAGIVTSALLSNHGAIELIAREGQERRDQTCRLFEGDYREDETAWRAEQERLDRTLDYIRGLSPRQRKRGINPAVIANLPNVRQDVRDAKREIDRPPKYCAEPGVGL
jgi:hypothetical protein